MWRCLALTLLAAIASGKGTLLLNMLIKNEAENLERTLPHWAKIADYWIIGVDDNNTDSSPEIIEKHLGHIPGKMVTVNFDGMGPTWTVLVKEGLKAFPEATHGILADADFKPMSDSFDKSKLDLTCSKHMFTIWTEDHQNKRLMDWIYRNIEGARVERRTHQMLKVPKIPGQKQYQTLVPLQIEEKRGGYQDRTGKKMERWLKKDLEDFPNDPRTLYYLGYSHFEIFLNNKDDPSQYHWDMLSESVAWYSKRAAIKTRGNKEERWFAMLKLGEIYERFYKDWDKAMQHYKECAAGDPDRADPFFYLGQHYRLVGQPEMGIEYMLTAARLRIPQRSLFHWEFLYKCFTKLELGRIVRTAKNVSAEVVKETLALLQSADCSEADEGEREEMRSLVSHFASILKGNRMSRTDLLIKAQKYMAKKKVSWTSLPKPLLHELLEKTRNEGPCLMFRRSTTPFLRFFREQRASLESHLDAKEMAMLAKIESRIRLYCR